jgi:arylformamidase
MTGEKERPRIIDVTVTLEEGMPLWPGSRAFKMTERESISRGDGQNVSAIECDAHSGTHVDAPRHHLEGGAPVDELCLDTLVGPSFVIDLAGERAVTGDLLRGREVAGEVERLIVKTGNSDLWGRSDRLFRRDYVAFDRSAAEWIVERGIGLVGIDYLSIEGYEGDSSVHRLLLQEGVVVVEGLDLRGVAQGEYEFICLPLKIAGAEGAPARAILRKGTL